MKRLGLHAPWHRAQCAQRQSQMRKEYDWSQTLHQTQIQWAQSIARDVDNPYPWSILGRYGGPSVIQSIAATSSPLDSSWIALFDARGLLHLASFPDCQVDCTIYLQNLPSPRSLTHCCWLVHPLTEENEMIVSWFILVFEKQIVAVHVASTNLKKFTVTTPTSGKKPGGRALTKREREQMVAHVGNVDYNVSAVAPCTVPGVDRIWLGSPQGVVYSWSVCDGNQSPTYKLSDLSSAVVSIQQHSNLHNVLLVAYENGFILNFNVSDTSTIAKFNWMESTIPCTWMGLQWNTEGNSALVMTCQGEYTFWDPRSDLKSSALTTFSVHGLPHMQQDCCSVRGVSFYAPAERTVVDLLVAARTFYDPENPDQNADEGVYAMSHLTAKERTLQRHQMCSVEQGVLSMSTVQRDSVTVAAAILTKQRQIALLDVTDSGELGNMRRLSTDFDLAVKKDVVRVRYLSPGNDALTDDLFSCHSALTGAEFIENELLQNLSAMPGDIFVVALHHQVLWYNAATKGLIYQLDIGQENIIVEMCISANPLKCLLHLDNGTMVVYNLSFSQRESGTCDLTETLPTQIYVSSCNEAAELGLQKEFVIHNVNLHYKILHFDGALVVIQQDNEHVLFVPLMDKAQSAAWNPAPIEMNGNSTISDVGNVTCCTRVWSFATDRDDEPRRHLILLGTSQGIVQVGALNEGVWTACHSFAQSDAAPIVSIQVLDQSGSVVTDDENDAKSALHWMVVVSAQLSRLYSRCHDKSRIFKSETIQGASIVQSKIIERNGGSCMLSLADNQMVLIEALPSLERLVCLTFDHLIIGDVSRFWWQAEILRQGSLLIRDDSASWTIVSPFAADGQYDWQQLSWKFVENSSHLAKAPKVLEKRKSWLSSLFGPSPFRALSFGQFEALVTPALSESSITRSLPSVNNSNSRTTTADANVFAQTAQALDERGHRLQQLSNQTEQLAEASSDFLSMARALAQKHANKKWYEL